MVDGRAHPQGEHTHGGHADQHNLESVFQGQQEGLILPKVNKVPKPHKGGGGRFRVHVRIGKAVSDADNHGDYHKADKENQAGQHEQVSGDIFPALQRSAHFGLGICQ